MGKKKKQIILLISIAAMFMSNSQQIQQTQTSNLQLLSEFKHMLNLEESKQHKIDQQNNQNKQHIKELAQLKQKQSSEKLDDFGDNFTNLLQIGEQIHTHVASGSRPPDETLVDTLTMMKNMLAQAQTKKAPSVAAQAAAAKQKAVHNIQKKLTANIMRKLDGNQPLVEVAKKLKIIQGFQPQIQDMERRMALLKQVEPVLESAIKILSQVVDFKGMGLKAPKAKPAPPPPEPEEVVSTGLPPGLDLAALLGQVKAAAPAAPEPEPEAEAEAPQPDEQNDMASMLSSLGLVQLSTGNQVKFDSNPNDGKDKDGFDDEIFIQDDTNQTPGLDDAVIIDPLSPALDEKDQTKLNKIVKQHQKQIKVDRQKLKSNQNSRKLF